MKRKSKRALFLFLSVAMILNGLTIGISVAAVSGNKDLAQYLDEFQVGKFPEGGTVVKDEDSPTGYMAHIVYTNATAESAVVYFGFAYFDPFEPDCNMTPGYNPWEYRNGMFAWSGQSRRAATEAGEIELGLVGGGSTFYAVTCDQDLLDAAASGLVALNSAGVPSSFGTAVNGKNTQVPMTKYEDATWYTCFPIVSGSCAYNIRINGTNSNVSGASRTIYGGFDPDKQMWDQTNHGNLSNYGGVNAPAGSSQTRTYDDIYSIHPEYFEIYEQYLNRDGVGNYPNNLGNTNTLSVWLPPGYDPNREEPYPVLYWCGGGGSGASVGNTTIAQNLIAQGLVEPFIMAGTGNSKYDGNDNRDSLDYDPKYPDALYANNSPVVFISLQNLAECVIPYMEANYNVSVEASGRAVAGFSQGGKWASRAAYVNAGMFGYAASFSCGDEGVALKLDDGLMPTGYDQIVFYLSGGCYDFGVNWINDVTKYRDNPWYGKTGGGGGGGTFPDGSCLQYYYEGLVNAGLQDNIYGGTYHPYPGDHSANPYGWEEFLTYVLWKLTPVKKIEYEPGVTVVKDDNSPTGYMAHFVYKNEVAQNVDMSLGFVLLKSSNAANPNAHLYPIDPWDWEDGVFQVNNNGRGMAYADGTPIFDDAGTGIALYNHRTDVKMTKYADGVWYTCIPIPSGGYNYSYLVDGSSVNDPANSSRTAWGKFDPDKQSLNRDAWMPASMTGVPAGTIVYRDYTDIRDETARLGIYLPPHYDPNRAEPYKTLYYSHGANGTETSAMGGNYANILDNLFAQGLAEEFIYVTMNNTKYDIRLRMIDPEAQESLDNLVYNIIPFIETNYNVSTEVSGRAVSGLSHGGKWTTRVHYAYPTMFGYYAPMGCADETVAQMLLAGNIPEGIDQGALWLGDGCYAFGWNWIYDARKNPNPAPGFPIYYEVGGREADGSCMTEYYDALVELGLYDGELTMVYGGHDNYNWHSEFEIIVKDFLWKATPGQIDAEFLQGKASDILKNGLSTNNLVLNGKTLTLIIDGREFVLSTNANNRNISGEIYLGNGHYLKFDIKGNGSNIKEFLVYKK